MEQYTGQRQETTLNEVAAAALAYRYTSKAQFCAVLESMGYACKDDDSKPLLHIYKGGEFLSIKELLQFEDAATHFAKIQSTIDNLLADNPDLTTKDINKLPYRQFGTKIHKGTIKWNDQTIELRPKVQEQLGRNNRIAMGLPPEPTQHIGRTPQQPQQVRQSSQSRGYNPLDKSGGSNDANREWEISSNMNVNEIDDENSQRAK